MDEDDSDDSQSENANNMHSVQTLQNGRDQQGPGNPFPELNQANSSGRNTQIPSIRITRNTWTPNQPQKSPAWQIVHPRKRARRNSNHSSNSENEEFQNSNRNRFSALQSPDPTVNMDENNRTTNVKTEPKPPPIVIPGVQNIGTLANEINKVVTANDYTHKTTNSGQLKIMANNSSTYRKIIHLLEDVGAAYHTYQLKQDRAYRVVIRALHHSTCTEHLKNEIEKLGYKVRNIKNIKSRQTKQALPLFFC